MNEDPIPFNRATIPEGDLSLLREAISRGHIAGGGEATARAEASLAAIHGGARALLTTSCTHALELSALLLCAQPGDEVIVPAFTFVSSAAAFLLHGFRPVFADVHPDTLGLEADQVSRLVGPRTRAICAVHYGGVGAEPDRLSGLAKEHGLALVEDNAHGLGGSWDGRRLGTFGAMSTLSFHETKNVTSGEGGALVVNDDSLVERAEILREKGTDRARFFRGQVDRYTWVDVGSSWVQSDLLASILVGQLDRIDSIQARRQAIWRAYREGLASWADEVGVRLPHVPPQAEHTAHLFHLRLPSLEERSRFIDHLAAAGISSVFHYQALHLSDVGRRLGGARGDCPVAEDAADTLVRLPLFTALRDDQVARIIERVQAFRVRD